MYELLEKRLAGFVNSGQEALLGDARIGLEKEGLRVTPKGGLSQAAHPLALGSALTNPYFTTDYSEAMVELITPPLAMDEALQFLEDEHRFVYGHLEDELLWVTSMPCVIAGETSIPLARYGKSNPGNMKTVYRRGLGYRYGRTMQVISGVHFNYSFSEEFWRAFQQREGDKRPLQEFISERYFCLLRNLQRLGWLIPYLFGASPAVCKSFLHGQATTLDEFNENTYYAPYATSLRMGDIGYQNNKENETGIKADYDSLEAYTESLTHAIETSCPRYEKIGVVVDGTYRQLNTNILQIENEYYSTVRPKQPPINNEKPTLALKKRGVQYVELRSLDVNAFEPLGIDKDQLRFLEALMIFCLLHDSPPISKDERSAIDHNEMTTAHRGREPGLLLVRNGATRTLKQWALELCDVLNNICGVLDKGEEGQAFSRILKAQREAVLDPDRTPSAIMLAEMRRHQEGFYHFARRMAEQHRRYFNAQPRDEARMQFFSSAASQSLQRQKEIEASDTLSFDEYLKAYFTQT